MFTAKLVKTNGKIRVFVNHNGQVHEFKRLKIALDWIDRVKIEESM